MKWVILVLPVVLAFVAGFLSRPVYDNRRLEEHRERMEAFLRMVLPKGTHIEDSKNEVVQSIQFYPFVHGTGFDGFLPTPPKEQLHVVVEVDSHGLIQSIEVGREKL